MMGKFKLNRVAVIYLLLSLVLGLIAGAVPSVAAEADDYVVETRDVAAFTGIRTEGDFLLRIDVGGDYALEVEAEPRDLKRITTTVEDETLVIHYRERFLSFLYDAERIVHISMPDLGSLRLLGEADVVASGIDSDAFDVEIEGSADIELNGRCGDLSIATSGMGDVSAEGLECERTTITINGMGDASIYASQSVSVLINGMGDVDVHGNPDEVKKTINGLGDVDMK